MTKSLGQKEMYLNHDSTNRPRTTGTDTRYEDDLIYSRGHVHETHREEARL